MITKFSQVRHCFSDSTAVFMGEKRILYVNEFCIISIQPEHIAKTLEHRVQKDQPAQDGSPIALLELSMAEMTFLQIFKFDTMPCNSFVFSGDSSVWLAGLESSEAEKYRAHAQRLADLAHDIFEKIKLALEGSTIRQSEFSICRGQNQVSIIISCRDGVASLVKEILSEIIGEQNLTFIFPKASTEDDYSAYDEDMYGGDPTKHVTRFAPIET